MAACGSLQHIFEKPLPENTTLLESLSSWKQLKSVKPVEESSFTEIFGELHFKENHPESSSSSSSPFPLSPASSSLSSSSLFADLDPETGFGKHNNERNKKSPITSYFPGSQRKQYRHSDSFSSMNSESLSLCTEGLGFESSDDVEDFKNDVNINWQGYEERAPVARHNTPLQSVCGEFKRSRPSGEAFPPPISCIGRSGKPWVCFKSYRHDGRFILKEIRIPTHEFLHACREGGRLKLQFVSSEDEIPEEDDEEEEQEMGEEGEQVQVIEGKGNNGDEHENKEAEEEHVEVKAVEISCNKFGGGC